MISPKEKALELYSKYCNFASFWMDQNDAKQCALIAVDEIIDLLWHTHGNETEYRYWLEVKQEIEKL
jgi:hypothetical protein